ncbi:hypothetical protein MMC10_000729 [Thelotrema lepadinum]|nr:hypothetical protein [Thelotrema lepadinum]
MNRSKQPRVEDDEVSKPLSKPPVYNRTWCSHHNPATALYKWLVAAQKHHEGHTSSHEPKQELGLMDSSPDRNQERAFRSQTYVLALRPKLPLTTSYLSSPLATDTNYALPTPSSGVAPEKASAILSQFSRKRKAAALAVPTDDGRVRAKLRLMVEPMTLFGEDSSDRRDRLRQLMLQEVEDEAAGGDEDEVMGGTGEGDGDEEAAEEEFYTEGIPELVAARRWMAGYSLPRAKERVKAQKVESGIALRVHSKQRKLVKERLGMFELAGSQIAGTRPVSIARFNPEGGLVAAGNWGGEIEILDVPNLDIKKSLNAHSGRVGGLAWMPKGGNGAPGGVDLASGGEEGSVQLFNLAAGEEPVQTLTGHSGRVCRVEFHPSGRYLASASYDTSWRLWDVETGTELVIQEGHSREVYTVSFNTDGSLLASAGLDSIGRIWDLRTGRTLMILDGHIREIYALDWGIDGYRVLSGSGDGFVKCWDLRMVREVGRIGAHKSVVSDLRWFKGLDSFAAEPSLNGDVGEMKPRKSGTFFVSSGYDKNVNIFSADDWALAKTLTGHSGNVMSVDVTADSKWIVSSGQDRTVKLWGCDDGLGI